MRGKNLNQKVFIIAGLAGIGKTAVSEAIRPEFGFRTIAYGDEMLRIAKKQHPFIANSDQMRQLLTTEQQKELQHAVAAYIAKQEGNLILPTHISIKVAKTIETPSGYLPGLPDDLLAMWNVSKLIYLTLPESHLQSLMKRRGLDASRNRNDMTLEQTVEQNRNNLIQLERIKAVTGAASEIIYNFEGLLHLAQKQLLEALYAIAPWGGKII